jgi:hypothetical protein
VLRTFKLLSSVLLVFVIGQLICISGLLGDIAKTHEKL